MLVISGCSSSSEDSEDNVDAFSTEINSLKIGDTITFGEYEQDNNRSNGKEPIEWIVLDKQDGRALVISKYGLEEMRNNSSDKAVTWEKSAVRDWLNYHFFDDAFTEEEQEYIAKTTVKADSNPDYYYTEQGYDTEDRVFLLSIQEAKRYFSSASDRRAPVTQYVLSEDAGVTSGYCYWWLRTMGSNAVSAALVWYDGRIVTDGDFVYDDTYVVRPALWLQPIGTAGTEQNNNQEYSVACSNTSISETGNDNWVIESDDFKVTIRNFWGDSGTVYKNNENSGIVIQMDKYNAEDSMVFVRCETDPIRFLSDYILWYKDHAEEKRELTIEETKTIKVNGMSVVYFTAVQAFKEGYENYNGEVVEEPFWARSIYGAVPIDDDKILIIFLGCGWESDNELDYYVDEESLRNAFEHIDITKYDN